MDRVSKFAINWKLLMSVGIPLSVIGLLFLYNNPVYLVGAVLIVVAILVPIYIYSKQ